MEMFLPVEHSSQEEQQAYRTYNGGLTIHNQHRAAPSPRPDQRRASARAAPSDLQPAGSAGHQGSGAGVSPLEGGGGGPESVVLGDPQALLGQPDRHVGVLGDKEDEECQGCES